MNPAIMGGGRREDVDLYVELAFGDDQNIKRLGEGLGERLDAELFSKRPDHKFRIIDIGCGGGWITLSALDYCLKKTQSRQSFIRIELLALDPDERGMLAALQAQLQARGAIQNEADPARWQWVAVGGVVDITICNMRFERFPKESRLFDAVLSFFTLQRLDDWREALDDHAKLVEPEGKGILVLCEMRGDYAGWSNRFDKILASDELAKNPKRLNYIRFIRCYHNQHRDDRNHLMFGSISASDLGPAYERLCATGFRPLPELPVAIQKKQVKPEKWLEGLGLIEGREPLFTFPLRKLKSEKKAMIADEMRAVAANSDNEFEALDQVNFSFFRADKSFSALVPEPSIGSNLRRIFSAVPACDVRKETELYKLVWEPDLLALVNHGVLDGVPLTFVLHHSLSDQDWFNKTPFHCRNDKLLTKVAIYYYLAIIHKNDLGIEGRTSQFLYRNLPNKCVIQTVYDVKEGSKVEFELEPDGRSLALLRISVPENVLSDRARELFDSATKVGQEDIRKRFLEDPQNPEFLPRLGGGWLLDNSVFMEKCEKSVAWTEAEPLLRLAKADPNSGLFYNSRILEEIAQKITDAFRTFAQLLDGSAWADLVDNDRETWRDWFPKALAIQSLLGMAELVHLPSRDAREEQEREFGSENETVEPKKRPEIEISTGGLILYLEKTLDERGNKIFSPRIKNLLLDVINLRNASLYVAAHREEATHRVLEQARKAAAAAIMARNMSHNLGSHPLARLAAAGGIAKYRESLTADPKENVDNADREIERFISYVRARMDFIAGISTLAPGWAVSLPLAGLIDEFVAEKYLLSTLTELGRTCSVTTNGDDIKDMKVMVPHARMGQQALYSILENVIRNSEKHGQPGNVNAGRVELRACLCPTLDTINLEIIDKGSPLSWLDGKLVTSKEINGSFLSLGDLISRLSEPFYSMERNYSKVEINPRFWGLKEMKISAAFLRLQPAFKVNGYTDDEEGTDGYPGTERAPWIEPFGWPDPETGLSFLSWRVRLLRPRPALIHEDLVKEAVIKKGGDDVRLEGGLGKEGYGVATEKVLRPQLNDSEMRESYSHRFLVVPIKVAVDLEKIGTPTRSLNYLPTRRIAVGTQTDGLPNEWATVTTDDWDNWKAEPVKMEAQLYRAWTDALARNAGKTNTASFPLLLAIGEKATEVDIKALAPGIGGAVMSVDTGALFADEGAISKQKTGKHAGGSTDALELAKFEEKRIIAYGRYHQTIPGAMTSPMDCKECLEDVAGCSKHKDLWTKYAQSYNAVRSGSPPFELAKLAARDERAALSMIEAGLVWIVVIDERIAERVKAAFRTGFAWAGVLVPDLLDHTSGKPSLRKHDVSLGRIMGQIDVLTAGTVSRPGRIIVTIHLGLLPSGSGQKGYLTALDAALRKRWRVPVEMVVHSGRGKTGEMKGELAGYKFLEFSNLDALMTARDDKITLVELMLSLRE